MLSLGLGMVRAGSYWQASFWPGALDRPHEDTEDAACSGTDSRRWVRTSGFLAALLTQRTDMFSHEAYILLREDHERCVEINVSSGCF